MLGFCAVVVVLSGVAMVSAYEAHTVNVTCKVENAITCEAPSLGLNFGTVFPEEWVTEDFDFGVSASFCGWPEQDRVFFIDYRIDILRKPIPDTDPVEYYEWLGDCLYIGINAVDKWPTTATHPGPGDLEWVGSGTPPIFITTGTLEKAYPGNLGDPQHTVTVGLDVPVFEGFWNDLTDALACPDGKPSGKDTPTVELTGSRNVPGGIELGADIVIQVTDIYKFAKP
jgi:hypothetical protein